MSKKITQSQILGEIGENAVRGRFLTMGFQFDVRSRLEAGIDGIAEVMDDGRPLGKMIAVQIKAKSEGTYSNEDSNGFSYLLRSDDLRYWQGSNLPVIIVLYREADKTFFWQEVPRIVGSDDKRLQFNKTRDVLDRQAIDRLAALTVPKAGFGYYVPPLGDGEDAFVNILPIKLPEEVFVATTPHDAKRASRILLDDDEIPRFDWVIKSGTFWSFQDPRTSVCDKIVDLDQVDAVETELLAFHEDEDERNSFSYLLRKTLDHQVRADLNWNKDRKLFYFRSLQPDKTRTFHYEASKKKTQTDVVNVVYNKADKSKVDFVRHHAFVPRFENLFNEWFLVINPTYFFTTNGLIPHSYPGALLAGKKRLDNSSALRGQLIMWHRFLTKDERAGVTLFTPSDMSPRLKFGEPPTVFLPTRVPEDVWGASKKAAEADGSQEALDFY